MSKELSIGKYRGLQQCATHRGALAVLALDHRNNLRRALNPEAPEAVLPSEMIAFKQQVTRILAPAASAVLLDPEVGAFQAIAAGALPGSRGLIVALEATGYTGDPQARQSRVLPGWDVSRVRQMGASAAKLLVYYHPDAPAASLTEELVAQVSADCAEHDIPLFLEPLSYSLDPARKKLTGHERRRVVIETARRLTSIGGDVLKAEFPPDIIAEPEEEVWAEACAELSGASRIPWVLLSASVDYEMYLRQVTVACQQGASGVAVGRAVWKEAPRLSGQAREEFLREVAFPRMERITALCNALARPWTEFYTPPDAGAEYFRSY
ncbi:MAG TPA: tagatose 1,6-diphosphate aldolase [Chloroflexi bacterium]|nr:tagatose 1,6-diphosphate aldolase [Chloroflexota bacterium]